MKAVIVAAFALAGALGSAYDDSILTTSEIVLSVSVAFVAFTGVFALTNVTLKTLVGTVVVALGAFATSLNDDQISAQEWTTIAVAVLGSLASVYAAGNHSLRKFRELHALPKKDVPSVQL